LAIFQVLKSFDFVKIWGRGDRLKEATLKKNSLLALLVFRRSYLGLKMEFSKLFEKMKVIVVYAGDMCKISDQ